MDGAIGCIEACHDCAQTCLSCADACMAEADVAELRQCIRLDLDCADICAMTGALASRRSGANPEDPAQRDRAVCGGLPDLRRVSAKCKAFSRKTCSRT